MTVTLFSTTGCGLCMATEKWLTRKGIRYTKVLIDDDQAKRDEFTAAGHLSMPVVLVEKAGQKVMEFAGFSDEKITKLRDLVLSS